MGDLVAALWRWLDSAAITPVEHFFGGLAGSDRVVFSALVCIAAALGFAIGGSGSRRWRRRSFRIGRGKSSIGFQNRGEARVSEHLAFHFRPPVYHLMNHVTLQMENGTTQVDHVLASRFGVFVIETKDYTGWLFANPDHTTWTQVRFKARFTFQNPIHQNARHVRAVRELLDFLPGESVKSLVVFTGDAEFKTPIPRGVLSLPDLEPYLRAQTDEVMSQNELQFCVGRLETARLALSRETDVQHAASLARRHRQ